MRQRADYGLSVDTAIWPSDLHCLDAPPLARATRRIQIKGHGDRSRLRFSLVSFKCCVQCRHFVREFRDPDVSLGALATNDRGINF